LLNPGGGGYGPGGSDLGSDLVDCVGGNVAHHADGLDAVEGLAAVGLRVGEVGQDVGQPGVRVEDGRHVVDVGGGPEVLVGTAGGDPREEVAIGHHKTDIGQLLAQENQVGLALCGDRGSVGQIALEGLDRQL